MPSKERVVVSVMKMTEGLKVEVVSVAFTAASIPFTVPFRDELVAKLAQSPATFGAFRVMAKPERPDWIILFTQRCSEIELDKALNAVANELGVEIFIQPGIPAQELSLEPATFRSYIPPDATPS